MKSIFLLFLVFYMELLSAQPVKTGAEQPELYLPLLEGKRLGLVVNHTAMIGQQHLLDYLLEKGISVQKIFCPEHGFRGDADAGEEIKDQTDGATGLPVISLYGNNKKPAPEHLSGLDAVVYDIQDVGVRFYTYLSTMHYVMEACAENKLPLIIFDRPNPNGDYVSGPVLDPRFKSFVGMHSIPVVHGCTLGELAGMINDEGWLKDAVRCDLTVVPVKNYTHQTRYSLPVKPSPNLPNDLSIRLYPSLCFFEATRVSIGRGTTFPFQVIGYPDPKMGSFQFTPVSMAGMAKNPLQEGKLCYGEDLRDVCLNHRFTLSYFLKYLRKFSNEAEFLSSERWFNLLAGTDKLLADIRAGKTEAEIEASWKDELTTYLGLRRNYLLYPDANCNE
ncbi:exo-beta-N-acetylmuramidase NamZ family protein [Gaoshiqia sp. Z1-71]|uniref:exo-beta-N-acetylmuramidase NamZ family protein n=1 Tax=Gaoshiqia hydrogeniformans TaxID=3290090 RepID=UPI003BF89F54